MAFFHRGVSHLRSRCASARVWPAGLVLSCGGWALSCDASPLLPAESLNQKPGRVQSLDAWTIVREGPQHFVERVDDRNERFKAPDGSNFVEGFAHPPFIKQHNWEQLRAAGAGARAGDIWVATYPKCGTTFAEQIVLLLLNNGDVSKMDPKNQNKYNKETGVGKIWVEANVGVGEKKQFTLDEFNELPAPRVLKTHAPRSMFLGVKDTDPPSLSSIGRPTPIANGVKVIYVARNAKDACVSAYYHAANPHKLGFPFDAWVKNWMSGLFEHGRWADHVLCWQAEALSNPEQVIWLRYEDLKANPEHEIRRVASFLNIDASDSLIERTVVGSGFKAMRMQSGNVGIFRKGVIGDSEKHFSPELNKDFCALYNEQMRGATDPYADFQ